jgi:hypothetical protein
VQNAEKHNDDRMMFAFSLLFGGDNDLKYKTEVAIIVVTL